MLLSCDSSCRCVFSLVMTQNARPLTFAILFWHPHYSSPCCRPNDEFPTCFLTTPSPATHAYRHAHTHAPTHGRGPLGCNCICCPVEDSIWYVRVYLWKMETILPVPLAMRVFSVREFVHVYMCLCLCVRSVCLCDHDEILTKWKKWAQLTETK